METDGRAIIMGKTFNLLHTEELSPKNRELFKKMEQSFGKVPNLYNIIAYSEHALDAYLRLEESSSSLSPSEVEAVNLVVSEVNNCIYCLSAHTLIAKSVGISENRTLEIRTGNVPSDNKLDSLVKLTKAISENRGRISEQLLENFFQVGYTKENLVDLIILIGSRTISNLLYAVTKVPVDFPLAKDLCTNKQ